MKKPGCNKCCVPFYCSLTNYECKRSTVTPYWWQKQQMFFSLLFFSKSRNLLPFTTVISQLYYAVTSIKRSCSPFTESMRLVCIIFHLYWMVTESGTVQLKLSEEFSFKQNFIHLFPPKSMLVIFLRKFFYMKWSAKECKKYSLGCHLWHKMAFFIVFITSLFCGACI